MKRKLVVLLVAALLVASQLACGNMTNESRTIDSMQTMIDQQILTGGE